MNKVQRNQKTIDESRVVQKIFEDFKEDFFERRNPLIRLFCSVIISDYHKVYCDIPLSVINLSYCSFQ